MMKIASFNVNGIRAILQKGFADTFEKLSPDILFLEESKWSEDSHDVFPFMPEGYLCYWTVSKVRKGYSGVVAYVKKEPLSVHYGLLDGKYDDEGRVITLEYPSCYVVGAYVPNSGDGLKRLSFRLGFEKDLLDYFAVLSKKKPIICTGDLNVAHEEIDLKNPKANTMNPGFTKEERDAFTHLLSQGYKDTFRELYPDQVTYSWWSYRFHAREKNAGWRIDYFVVSDSLMEKVRDSQILTDVMGSDHCPVVLDIDL